MWDKGQFKSKRILCLILIFVFMISKVPVKSIFAVEEGTTLGTEAALETDETSEATETLETEEATETSDALESEETEEATDSSETEESEETEEVTDASETEESEETEEVTDSSETEESEETEEATDALETEEATGTVTVQGTSQISGQVTYTNSISGALWIDMYESIPDGIYGGDGIRQESEMPLPGYAVSLYMESDRNIVVAVTETDEDGMYEFTDFEPGTYVVGVATTTMDGIEYLLPFNMTDDNAFVMAYDTEADAYLYAYTEPISIEVDSVITGVDAGMRTPPGMQTMADEGQTFWVTSESNTAGQGTWSLGDVANIINNGTVSGTEYTITVRSDYNTGYYLDDSNKIIGENFYIWRSNIKIKLISDSASTLRTITVKYSGWALCQIAGANCTLTLQNVILDGNNSSGGFDFGIYLVEGNLIMDAGSKIQNFNNTTDYYNVGGIFLENSTFIMNADSEIFNNKSTDSGGGVILNNCNFTMNGGTISNNTAPSGGGGVQLKGGTFTMNGGTISNNTTNIGGGGVNLLGGTFTMNGGTIELNEATDGAGVNITSSGVFTMTENAIIQDNTASASGGGVFVSSGCSFELKKGSSAVPTIHKNIATQSGGGVYVLYDADPGTVFTMTGGIISNNEAKGTEYNSQGGGIAFCIGDKHIYSGTETIEALQVTLTGGEIISNTAITGGGIGFINNLTGASTPVQFTIDGTVVGGTSEKANKAVNYDNIANNGGNGGGVGTTTSYGAGITIILKSGSISYNEAASNGGGVNCDPGTSFTMKDGNIDYNKAAGSGGGVFFHTVAGDAGFFNMQNGSISHNEAYEGGGLYICAYSASTISGGLISANEAINCGGGICIKDGSSQISISNTTISYNKALPNGWGFEQGGGIYVLDPANLYIRNTTFANNSARNGGGGIFTTTEYGEVYDQYGQRSGKNVPACYSNLDINASVIFTNNSAAVAYPPPDSATIAEFFPTVRYATSTTLTDQTILATLTQYQHALNHYDINRVLYEVTVISLDPSWAKIEGRDDYIWVPNGNGVSTTPEAYIAGLHYVYTMWKEDDKTTSWNNADANDAVALPYVFADTTIFLYYVSGGSITINKKFGENPLNGVTYKLEKWDTATNTWVNPAEGTTQTINGKEGMLVFSSLEPGKYQITETAVPEGYSLLAKAFEAVIPYKEITYGSPKADGAVYSYCHEETVDGVTSYTYYYYDLTYTVTNQLAFDLPAAGSGWILSQYYIYTGIGLILLASGFTACRLRRRYLCGGKNMRKGGEG